MTASSLKEGTATEKVSGEGYALKRRVDSILLVDEAQ